MSAKPVTERLRVKAQTRLAVLNAPNRVDARIGVRKSRAETNAADVVLLFIHHRAELDKYLPPALASLKDGAIFWLAYPKLTSKLAADLNRDVIAKLVPAYGLETVAQITIDEDWTALRLKHMR